MWHAADQLGRDGCKPVASDRINPDWAGDDVADLGQRIDGDVVGGCSVVLIGVRAGARAERLRGHASA